MDTLKRKFMFPYGLKKEHMQWYKRLSNFLLEQNFERGKVDETLFIKKSSHNVLLVQVYVDDIIFGSINKSLSEDFMHKMQREFEMSMI